MTWHGPTFERVERRPDVHARLDGPDGTASWWKPEELAAVVVGALLGAAGHHRNGPPTS